MIGEGSFEMGVFDNADSGILKVSDATAVSMGKVMINRWIWR